MEKVLLIQSNGTLIDYSFGYQQPFIFQHKTPLPFHNKYYGFTHGIEYNWGGRGELKPITPRNTCRQNIIQYTVSGGPLKIGHWVFVMYYLELLSLY